MAEPKLSISVAMCTYNGSQFLREQLTSIAAQVRLPDELVICDDGSTDSTPQIVADFASSVAFPVRWIRNEVNLGSTKNFEKAIGLCTGDLIALSDQDDIWLPEKLARQAEMFELDPALGGVFSDAELIDDKSQPIGKRLWPGFDFTTREKRRFKQGGAVAVMLKRNVVTGATLMIRSSLRSVFTPIADCWQHDGWIAWMAVIYSKLGLIEEPLIRYRIHASQQIGVEAIARSQTLTLRQRLARAKREEPPEQLSGAGQLEILARRLATTHDQKSDAVRPALRQKSRFLVNRGKPCTNRAIRAMSIMWNKRNYELYGAGWKELLRDIAILFA